MKPNSFLREEATLKLEGKWGFCVALSLVYYIIVQVAGNICTAPLDLLEVKRLLGADITSETYGYVALFPVFLIVLICFNSLMSWGYTITFLRLFRDKKKDLSYLFAGFQQFKRVLGTMLLMTLYILLWTLLFIIPGYIKQYSYAMTPYILEDRPDLSYDEAIEESMRMMDGYKGKLFCLHLSFIGWGILAILTCGIGFLWLYPYIMTAQAAFYEDRKADFYPETAEEEPVVEEEVVVDEPVKEEVAQEKVVAEPANLKNEGHYDKG